MNTYFMALYCIITLVFTIKRNKVKHYFIFIIIMYLSSSLLAKQNIKVYSYHNHPPFIKEDKTGKSHEIIKFLNDQSDIYSFSLHLVPRKRFNAIIRPWINNNCNMKKQCDSKWIVLWVNEKWGFGNKAKETFFWTNIFEDSNLIVSRKDKYINYSKISDLINKTIAGVNGHIYVGIDKLVKQNKINRINGKNTLDNLHLLLLNRVDATIIPKSTYLYYKNIHGSFNQLKASTIPQQRYVRNIMTNNKNPKLVKFLNSLDYKRYNLK